MHEHPVDIIGHDAEMETLLQSPCCGATTTNRRQKTITSIPAQQATGTW